MRKLKTTEVATARAALQVKQGNECPLCKSKFTKTGKKPALDHDHITGAVRGVLCINCNGMEGKVFNRANRAKGKLTVLQWMKNLVEYLEKHSINRTGLIHPAHKTEAEKKLAQAKRRKVLRDRKKAQK